MHLRGDDLRRQGTVAPTGRGYEKKGTVRVVGGAAGDGVSREGDSQTAVHAARSAAISAATTAPRTTETATGSHGAAPAAARDSSYTTKAQMMEPVEVALAVETGAATAAARAATAVARAARLTHPPAAPASRADARVDPAATAAVTRPARNAVHAARVAATHAARARGTAQRVITAATVLPTVGA